jgi:hypothetical protein
MAIQALPAILAILNMMGGKKESQPYQMPTGYGNTGDMGNQPAGQYPSIGDVAGNPRYMSAQPQQGGGGGGFQNTMNTIGSIVKGFGGRREPIEPYRLPYLRRR